MPTVWPHPAPLGKSELEAVLANRLERLGAPTPEREYHFARTLGRQWRWDFAWPAYLLAVEVEGGGFVQGRHVRGAGHAADCEKYNAGALLGWRLLRYTGAQIKSEQNLAAQQIMAALRQLGAPIHD